jgi:O-antigen/teichoic acid export membrane protein
MLSVFNPDYAAYYPALLILSLGTAAMGAAGPSATILVFTGHEGRYLLLMAGAVAARIIGFAVLVPPFGITGAVVATAGSFLLMAAMLTRSARGLAGIDGSVLRLLRRHGDRPPLLRAAE